jgi:oligopeptide transport system permease protein
MKVRAEHAGALLIVAIAAAGVAAPWLSPSAPGDCRLAWELLPPSPAHPFGTDSDGCDIAATVLFGTRTSLGIGLVVAAV